MKKVFLILLVGMIGTLQALPKDFSLYWVGNSLMCGGWACNEGWEFVGKVMINPDSTALGMAIHAAALKRGATDIPSHYKQDSAGQGTPSNSGAPCIGINELNNPTGCTTYQFVEPYCGTQNNYDYLILQGYRWDATMAASEYDYCSRYYDLGLSNGTKPIIFACWSAPQVADQGIAIYDSLFRKYKNRGAIYAPVIQAHKLVWADPAKDPATYLYDNDPYHHVNRRGAWLMCCVFYEIFTGQPATGLTLANLKRACNSATMDSMSTADLAYCAGKAHQAVINYYGAGNVPHLGISAVDVSNPASKRMAPAAIFSKQGARLSIDLAGREISHPGMQKTGPRVVIAKDAAGRTGKAVVGGR
jgi:hypothetical protein